MASIWKRSDSKFWVACFTASDGRQLKKSTKATDRKTAQRIADELEKAYSTRRTAVQVRKLLAAIHTEITGEKLPEMSVRAFIANWLERKKPETSDATITFYRNATGKFLTFLGGEAEGDIARITRDHVTRFRNEEAKSLAPNTVNHELKCLRMAFRSAKRDGYLVEDPAEFVDTIRDRPSERKSRRPFTDKELRAVLAVADEEWRSMILCGFYTGQRLGDIASLRWSNVDLIKGTLELTTRKTGKGIRHTVPAALLRHLVQLPSSDDPEAPLHPKAFAMFQRQGQKSGNLSNQFADLLASAGLRDKKAHRASGAGRKGTRREMNGLSFHSLRHTVVSMLKEAGTPAATVMEVVGHDSEQMSQHYTHVGDDAIAKALESLPDFTC